MGQMQVTVCDYIERHGCPINCNNSYGEILGKLKTKDNEKFINKQKDTPSFDIERSISENDVIDQSFNIYFQNKGYWPSEFCNKTVIPLSADKL